MSLFKKKSEEEIMQERKALEKRRENYVRRHLFREEVFALVGKVEQWYGLYEDVSRDPRKSFDYGKYKGKVGDLSISVSREWGSCWFFLVPYGIRREYSFEVFIGDNEAWENTIGFAGSTLIFATDRREYKKVYDEVRKKYLEQQVLKFEQFNQAQERERVDAVAKAREQIG